MSYPARAEGLVNSTFFFRCFIKVKLVFKMDIIRYYLLLKSTSLTLCNKKMTFLHRDLLHMILNYIQWWISSFRALGSEEYPFIAITPRSTLRGILETIKLYINDDKQSKEKLATIVEDNLKTPFSIATTPRCRGGRYSFPWITPLYPWYVSYNTEC